MVSSQNSEESEKEKSPQLHPEALRAVFQQSSSQSPDSHMVGPPSAWRSGGAGLPSCLVQKGRCGADSRQPQAVSSSLFVSLAQSGRSPLVLAARACLRLWSNSVVPPPCPLCGGHQCHPRGFSSKSFSYPVVSACAASYSISFLSSGTKGLLSSHFIELKIFLLHLPNSFPLCRENLREMSFMHRRVNKLEVVLCSGGKRCCNHETWVAMNFLIPCCIWVT